MDLHIINLLSEYLTGEMSDLHQAELEGWLNEREANRQFFERFCADRSFRQRWELRQRIDVDAAMQKFENRTGGKVVLSVWKKWGLYSAVAAILVVAVGVAWFYLRQTTEIPEMAEAVIMPGSAKAVLVLADGAEVNLGRDDSLSVDLSSGVQAVNMGKQLIYKGGQSVQMQYNELRVPRGGEFEVVLADGTLVKLNAESTLKYPETFGSEQREVVLTGEAYFQVTKSEVPFIVKVGGLSVRVYGTSFNINTQKTDRIQTVLVEGKVGIKMAENDCEYILSPSQLADYNTSTGKLEVKEIDLTPYTAWTRGEFVFENQRLEEILETLSLWYDIEVFYQNSSLKDLHFTGYVKRYQTIDQILNALSQSVGVKFSQQGKTLMVSK